MSNGKEISKAVRDKLNKNGLNIEKRDEYDYIKPLQTLYEDKYHKQKRKNNHE